MSSIKTRKKGQQTYYELWDKGKFIKHIGDAEKLRVFMRDVEKGKEAAEILKRRPDLAPRAIQTIIAESKRLEAPKFNINGKKYHTIVIDPPWPMDKILRDERPNVTKKPLFRHGT